MHGGSSRGPTRLAIGLRPNTNPRADDRKRQIANESNAIAGAHPNISRPLTSSGDGGHQWAYTGPEGATERWKSQICRAAEEPRPPAHHGTRRTRSARNAQVARGGVPRLKLKSIKRLLISLSPSDAKLATVNPYSVVAAESRLECEPSVAS